AESMRTGSHRDTHLQRPIHGFIILVSRWCHSEQFHALPVQQQLQLVRLAQALDLFIAVPRQPYLNLVLTIAGEGIGKHRATTRSDGKTLDVLFLSEVR